MMKRNVLLMMLMVLVGLGTACEFSIGGGDDTAEANKFIDEAAALNKSYVEDHNKAEKMRSELFGPAAQEAEDFAAYKEENKAKFTEYQALIDKVEKNSAETASKLEAASKTKISGPFKEYIDVKVQEVKKRNEADKLVVSLVKSVMAENDLEKAAGIIGEQQKKIVAAMDEAAKLQTKAAEIVKKNPEAISGK